MGNLTFSFFPIPTSLPFAMDETTSEDEIAPILREAALSIPRSSSGALLSLQTRHTASLCF
jgi:hypothetical protein